MKYAPQMLQLLREIDDLVSSTAGSSCSCLRICGWAGASAALVFTVPALHQRPVHLGCWPGPQLWDLVSQDHHLWGNLQEGSSPGLGQQLVRPFEISDSEGPKSHPMAVTWRSRLFCPWVMCLMPRSRAGASRNPMFLTLTQPVSWVIPKSGTAHWLQPPKLKWISPVLGPRSFHSIRFLGFCNGLLMQRYFCKMWRAPSGVIPASWLWCSSWFMWGRVRQTRTFWWPENAWLELVRKCFVFLLQNLRKVINTSNFYRHNLVKNFSWEIVRTFFVFEDLFWGEPHENVESKSALGKLI